ncbi:MAG: glycosyltransferase, partial [Bacteroidota bacterium]
SLPLACVAMGADVLEYPPHISQAVAADRRWESAGSLGPRQRLIQQMKWHFFRHQVRRTLRASQLVTGDNLELVRAVRDWFHIHPDRLQLNRWGIEPELFQADLTLQEKLRQQMKLDPGQRMILSPRGLKPVYQADVVLGGFQRLLEAGDSQTKLVVMGTGYQTPPHLDQWAHELHQKYPNFHYQRDLLPREWMPQLWQITDAFVNLPAYDGFSNALNEGRYAGAVPIVNDIPAHREVCEDGIHAYYLDEATADGLASYLQGLIPRLDSAKALLAAQNQQWVKAQAVLLPNMKKMREWMQDLLEGADYKLTTYRIFLKI